MTQTAFKETIREEVLALLQNDAGVRNIILEITGPTVAIKADKQETDDKFYQILGELQRDREAQRLKWDEQERKWVEQQDRWAEQQDKWKEWSRKWDAAQLLAEERWNDTQKNFAELRGAVGRLERTIGGLGARWGMQSEKAFRDALAGILEEHFPVKVRRVNEYDDAGDVFGRPDQVELDIIVTNGLLLICELKSSMTRSNMYAFERKARFYEKRHNCKADRLIVISPMIDARAKAVAGMLGITIYGDPADVESL